MLRFLSIALKWNWALGRQHSNAHLPQSPSAPTFQIQVTARAITFEGVVYSIISYSSFH